MIALDVLNTIRQAGGSYFVEAENLRIVAPPGLLTAEHKTVLASAKADLIRLLAPDVDPERAAIQWVESLSAEEGEVVIEQARREWNEIVGPDLDNDLNAWAERQIGSKVANKANKANKGDTNGGTDHITAMDADADAIWDAAIEPPPLPQAPPAKSPMILKVKAGRRKVRKPVESDWREGYLLPSIEELERLSLPEPDRA
ncbi:MAG: hypothetical protein KKE86_08790 [Planctomycetes bacterium]|nr:hypothetical protein [Planctomycetota bacterium]